MKVKDWNDDIFGFDVVLLGKSNTLILSCAIIDCFQKVKFTGFILLVWNFEFYLYETLNFHLHSGMLDVVIRKKDCLLRKYRGYSEN